MLKILYQTSYLECERTIVAGHKPFRAIMNQTTAEIENSDMDVLFLEIRKSL